MAKDIKFIYSCLAAQLCPTLCDSVDCSPPGSSVHGVSQGRTLEWVLPDPGIELGSPALAGGFFTAEPPGKPVRFIGKTRIALSLGAVRVARP